MSSQCTAIFVCHIRKRLQTTTATTTTATTLSTIYRTSSKLCVCFFFFVFIFEVNQIAKEKFCARSVVKNSEANNGTNRRYLDGCRGRGIAFVVCHLRAECVFFRCTKWSTNAAIWHFFSLYVNDALKRLTKCIQNAIETNSLVFGFATKSLRII